MLLYFISYITDSYCIALLQCIVGKLYIYLNTRHNLIPHGLSAGKPHLHLNREHDILTFHAVLLSNNSK